MLLTAAQLIIKMRLNAHGSIPFNAADLFRYAVVAVQDVRLVGGFLLLIVAALGWYGGISRVPLSIAFPIAALSYPLIYLGAIIFLNEEFSWLKLGGNAVVVVGILIATSGG